MSGEKWGCQLQLDLILPNTTEQNPKAPGNGHSRPCCVELIFVHGKDWTRDFGQIIAQMMRR